MLARPDHPSRFWYARTFGRPVGRPPAAESRVGGFLDLATGAPTGISLAVGAVAVVTAAMVAAALPASAPAWRAGMLGVTVCAFAAITVNWRAVAGVGLLAWLVADGFLENRRGDLSWHGSSDTRLITVVVATAGIGLAIGATWHRVGSLREQWHAGEELDRIAAQLRRIDAQAPRGPEPEVREMVVADGHDEERVEEEERRGA